VAFITDKEELKPGLILFRRTDVAHDNWYCRVKLPTLASRCDRLPFRPGCATNGPSARSRFQTFPPGSK
jgi:hypothetical protein